MTLQAHAIAWEREDAGSYIGRTSRRTYHVWLNSLPVNPPNWKCGINSDLDDPTMAGQIAEVPYYATRQAAMAAAERWEQRRLEGTK